MPRQPRKSGEIWPDLWHGGRVFDIAHEVSLFDPAAHLLEVKTTIRASGDRPLPSPLTLFMPVWTPGSYLVREFARHLEGFSATSGGVRLGHEKIRKNAWQIDHTGATVIEVSYRVYANDLSVRTNHADATHAYWNGAATYLAVESAPTAGARVTATMPSGWDVATALERDPSARRDEPRFLAKSLDELCDAPFECGKLIERSFVAHGKAHRIAAWDNPDARTVDWDKLAADTQTIVETEAALLAGERSPRDALPYDRYLFIWHVSPRGRGGLEHRSCATLMAKPSSFQTRTGYLDVLSLVAHEFFHLWNVKRVRPAGLVPHRYQEENYTRLLWWFEGATSYYDWRTLGLAKLCTAAEYLTHLAEEIVRLEDTPGTSVHSLEESSFDAWIKAYRPDENSLNSTVSYYLKGEIVCALIDLELRRRTGGRASLDDVLRHLYWEFGAKEMAVPERALPGIVERVSGASLDDCFDRWVTGTERVAVNDVLGHAGLKFERTARRDGPPASIGARMKLEAGRAVVEAVPRGGAAHKAGIDARDEIIAVGGRRLPEGRIDVPLFGLSPGDVVPVVLSRDGWLRTVDLTLDPPVLPEGKIVPIADAPPQARELYQAWLGEPLAK
jgi:predicted metalloprotease with PDZ domain